MFAFKTFHSCHHPSKNKIISSDKVTIKPTNPQKTIATISENILYHIVRLDQAWLI
jgi:hypothetical protein